MPERTVAQMQMLGAWALHGPEQFLTKVHRGHGWLVTIGSCQIPKVFRTKREAIQYVDRAIREMTRPRDPSSELTQEVR